MTEHGAAKTVLVADDDADIRAVVAEAVGSLGLEAIQASDGVKACSFVDAVEFDLAILDFTMPEKDGLEVCKYIKSRPHGASVHVIMLTARDSVDDKVLALGCGADDYLTKPFAYRELQARVRAGVRIRDLSVALRRQNEELLRIQEKLIASERQLVAFQVGGTAAHRLGQPLQALMLNLHLVASLSKEDPRFRDAVESMRVDADSMVKLLDELKEVDASKRETYHGEVDILRLS